MKKVTILDKSTLSRHFLEDTENSQFSNNSTKVTSNLKDSLSQSNSQSQSESTDSSAGSNYNSHLRGRSNSQRAAAQPIRLGVLPNGFSEPRRHMYSRAADRSIAINDRIERMARKWTSLESSPCSYEELSHPSRVSPVKYYKL